MPDFDKPFPKRNRDGGGEERMFSLTLAKVITNINNTQRKKKSAGIFPSNSLLLKRTNKWIEILRVNQIGCVFFGRKKKERKRS